MSDKENNISKEEKKTVQEKSDATPNNVNAQEDASPLTENTKKEANQTSEETTPTKEISSDEEAAKASSSSETPEPLSANQEAPTNATTESEESSEKETATQDKEENEEAQRELDDANAEESEDESVAEKHGIPKKDYHAMRMEELVKELSELLKKEKIQAIKEHVDEIKTEFNAKFDEELEQKKEDFVEDGGNIIDFYHSTPLKKEFNDLYFDYKEKRNNYYKELKHNLNKNLENRLSIIEELKGMIGVGTNMNVNFQEFKALQERWKKAGPIPRDKYNLVWNNYHHHVEHFYDFLHLDREFRDLDFKHNLDQKLKIIVRAEELAEETNINRAFRELQMLHKMWKEDLGPVEKKYREEIWEKFSEVTKKIHQNRQAYFAELDKKQVDHLEIKKEIISKIEVLAEGEIKTHSQAQQKIKEIESLREAFFKAGKVPKKDNSAIWDSFKSTIRAFNRKKNSYYKNLKKSQFDNLEKKKELIAIAESNQDNEDFAVVTPLMKKIQNDWKKIGHVPRKHSDKVWKQFKKACNHYFERLHAFQDGENKEENEAFDKKKETLTQLKELELPEDHQAALDLVKAQIEAWKNIGRVPRNKRYIEGKFNKQLDQLFDKLDMGKKEAEMLKYENRIQALDDSDNPISIEKEEFFLRKKIDESKSEIRQLENNLQFFSNVQDDNPLVQEVHQKIARHKEQLETWKAKLKKVKAL